MTELHPLTKLMLARMESHPEEFRIPNNSLTHPTPERRWYATIDAIREYGSDADKQAFNAKYNLINMDAAHELAMDELLNGEERRRKQREEEEEYERRMSAAQRQIMANQTAINSQYANQASPYGAGGGLSSAIATTTPIATPNRSTFDELIKRIKP